DHDHQEGEREEDAADASRGAGPEFNDLDGLRTAHAKDAGVEDADGDEEAERAENVQEQRCLIDGKVGHGVGSFPSDPSAVSTTARTRYWSVRAVVDTAEGSEG